MDKDMNECRSRMGEKEVEVLTIVLILQMERLRLKEYAQSVEFSQPSMPKQGQISAQCSSCSTMLLSKL
jgi:hypothetical protein